MRICVLTILAFQVCYGSYLKSECEKEQLPLHIDGARNLHKNFGPVFAAFRQNFVDGWEPAGAALAVYYKEELVVDVWGGYANVEARQKWQKDTLTPIFSTGKGLLALCVAILADKKLLNYDELVEEYWPRYSKNGKGNTTVQSVMSHMAGLPYFDSVLTLEQAANHTAVREIIENESPKWKPGTKAGYHGTTFGWLVDQLIRSTDPKRRGSALFFKEEIADKYGIDCYIGLPTKEYYRVARVVPSTAESMLAEILTTPKLATRNRLRTQNPLKQKTNKFLPWFDYDACNGLDLYQLEQGAMLGVSNARALAKLYNELNSLNIITKQTYKELQKVIVNETDVINGDVWVYGYGYSHYVLENTKVMGNNGRGCQQTIIDPVNNLIIAYVTNGMKVGLVDDCRTFSRITQAIYEVIPHLNSSSF